MEALKTLLLGTPPTRTYTSSATGLLTAANNLSDVADAATARTNIGVAAKVSSTTDNAVVRFDGTSGQQQNSAVTIDDSGSVSASGVAGLIGQATASNRYFDVGSSTDGQTVGYNLGVFDGANNYRSSLFLDDSAGLTGVNMAFSSGDVQFQIQRLGAPLFTINSSGTTLAGNLTVSGTQNTIGVPASANALTTNSTMTFELTSNTSLTIKVRGTDGTTRSVALTLA